MFESSQSSGRSAAPRAAARAHLQALRAARLARKKTRGGCAVERPVTEAPGAPLPEIDTPTATNTSLHVEGIEPTELQTKESIDQIAGENADGDVPEVSSSSEEVPATDMLNPGGDLPAPHSDAPVDADTTIEAENEDTAVSVEQIDTGLPPSDSSLFQLPGAGPGLVWLLMRAGVNSLEEFAEANPSTLRQSLGVVGDIVDIDYWLEWSQSRLKQH